MKSMFKGGNSYNSKTQVARNMRHADVLTIDQLVHQDDWVSDSERYRCHVCTRNFNTLRRKHHCRRCGEVVCGNCTLYKEAELPVIGRSKVRVCMSCILSNANSQENPQSPPAPASTASTPSPVGDTHDRWETRPLQSPSRSSSQDGDPVAIGRDSVNTDFDYPLDFNWEHSWPKPPIVPGEAERLDVLREFDILDTPPEDVFDIICDLASNALKCPIAAVSLIDEDRQWFKASVGLAQNEIPRNVSFCAHTIMSKEPLVVMDTTQDRRFERNPLVTGAANIRFYAGASIVTSQGVILGTVFVFDTRPRDSCDIATLEKLANVAMKNLEDRKNAVVENKIVQSPPHAVAAVPASNPAPVVVESTPVSAPIPAANDQIVAAAPNASVAADGSIVSGPRMENMLMDLLCRTTETQQQLATQQGAMFHTIGEHTSKIDELTNAVARMEAKLSQQEKQQL